jgi:hypothetical protein
MDLLIKYASRSNLTIESANKLDIKKEQTCVCSLYSIQCNYYNYLISKSINGAIPVSYSFIKVPSVS